MIEKYIEHFSESPSDVKNAKYVTIFIARKTESECIFRTDKEISNEITLSGKSRKDMGDQYARVYLSKRKQIAPERRTGREILRKLGMLNKENPCEINKAMCGVCLDCRLYGSAVGNAVSMKSHVISDESFSMLPYDVVTDEHTFNALFESGTMVDPATGKHSQAINTDEVVRPGEFFLDMETISDVTIDEFIYVLGNIARTSRYGAMTSRLGKMSNTILGMVFSNCELFSNLEWTQETYDEICHVLETPDGQVPAFPVDPKILAKAAKDVMDRKIKETPGSITMIDGTELVAVLDEIFGIYKDEGQLKSILSRIENPA